MSTVTENVAGLFASDFSPLYPQGVAMHMNFNPEMRLMSHPIEDGSSIVDFSIMLPMLVEVEMMVRGDDYKNTFQLIWTAFLKRDRITIVADSGTYPNMVISAVPHDQSADNVGVIPLTLKLTEVITAKTTFQSAPVKPRSAKNSNTVKRGEQAPKKSVAFSIFGG